MNPIFQDIDLLFELSYPKDRIIRVHILVAFIVTIASYNKKKKYMVAEHFDMLPNDFSKIADRTMIVNAHSISKLIIDYT